MPEAALAPVRRWLRQTPLRSLVLGWRARGKPADPLKVELVPKEAFRAWIREVVRLYPMTGHYVEFGVYNGLTLSLVYDALNRAGHEETLLYGFDSFEGLPAGAENEGRGMWQAGQCACDLETAVRFLDGKVRLGSRVFLVKGWFKDTLTEERQREIGRVSLILIDSDLYSSASEALTFVEPLIKDTAVVIFDDWHGFQAAAQGLGEAKAFEEFLALYPHFDVEDLPAYSAEAMAFRLTRRP
jgi:hypothetical protein